MFATRTRFAATAGALLVALASTYAQQHSTASYPPVTAERLKRPADGDWLMVRRTYDGWNYSPLAEITPDNVKRLQPVWSFATDVTNGHEAPPIVNGNTMFVSTPGNQVLALNAK